jgi:hypothetical protein
MSPRRKRARDPTYAEVLHATFGLRVLDLQIIKDVTMIGGTKRLLEAQEPNLSLGFSYGANDDLRLVRASAYRRSPR